MIIRMRNYFGKYSFFSNRLLFTFTFIFFLFGRIYPYLQSSVPLGYDPGLYLYLFKQYSHIPLFSLGSLPRWMTEMYQPGIPILGKLLTNFFSAETILIPFIVFFETLLFLSLFLLAKKLWDKKTALWTVFIFTCSAIQYRFYWYYYLKNIAALSFLLLTFYFLSSFSYWALLFSILTIYFHQQTGFFLLAVLIFLTIIQKNHRRYHAKILGITLLFSFPYYLSTVNQSILPLVQPTINGFLPTQLGGTLGIASGSFYDLKEAFLLSLPYLFFGLWGLFLLRRQEKAFPIILSFFITLPIILFNFFFSRRFIPFTDLFLIIFAGFGASSFFKGKRIFSIIFLCFMLVFISIFIKQTAKPLIFQDELREITMLSTTEPGAYILVTDANYTPWVYGWSNRKTIAPGFGEYNIYWTESQWKQFWISGDRQIEKDLLLKLPGPLYIYNGDDRYPYTTDFSTECFTRINWRTFKFICQKN